MKTPTLVFYPRWVVCHRWLTFLRDLVEVSQHVCAEWILQTIQSLKKQGEISWTTTVASSICRPWQGQASVSLQNHGHSSPSPEPQHHLQFPQHHGRPHVQQRSVHLSSPLLWPKCLFQEMNVTVEFPRWWKPLSSLALSLVQPLVLWYFSSTIIPVNLLTYGRSWLIKLLTILHIIILCPLVPASHNPRVTTILE